MIEILSITYCLSRKNAAVHVIKLKRRHYVKTDADRLAIQDRIARIYKTTHDRINIDTKDWSRSFKSEKERNEFLNKQKKRK
jgi:hypothetical protein